VQKRLQEALHDRRLINKVRCDIRPLIAFLISCSLVLATYFAIGLDAWAGASRSVVFEAFFIAFGILMGALLLQLGSHKALLVIPSAYILLLLVLPFIDLSPVKPAVRAVHEIRPGMTEFQVRVLLERHFPENGRFKRPAIGALHEGILAFVLDPNDGRYNAAVVQVRFSAGKCASAEFLPD
jgi:hypothetical protein